MIIQIDHIALSSDDIEGDVETMKRLGYRPVFVEKDIKNLRIKRDLLSVFNSRHDAALMVSDGNFGVELIDHKHTDIRRNNIMPVFENVPEGFIEEVEERQINGAVFMEADMKDLDAPVYCLNNAEAGSFRFNKAVVKTRDVRRSIAFWQCFGFRVIQHAEERAVMEFASPVSKYAYRIYLQNSDSVNDMPLLDNAGYNCIGFISTEAENEKDVLDGKGFRTTGIEDVTLNGRTFDIFFAIGDCGELAEVISVKNERIAK
ncbi:MAG: hypothetical protein ABIG55_03440 [Candidatus Omnitrophota bacterium]